MLALSLLILFYETYKLQQNAECKLRRKPLRFVSGNIRIKKDHGSPHSDAPPRRSQAERVEKSVENK